MPGIAPVEQPSREAILMNYGSTKTRVRLAGGGAILALSAGAAMAQEGVEQVVVSSTRLQSAGFDAPTPDNGGERGRPGRPGRAQCLRCHYPAARSARLHG